MMQICCWQPRWREDITSWTEVVEHYFKALWSTPALFIYIPLLRSSKFTYKLITSISLYSIERRLRQTIFF